MPHASTEIKHDGGNEVINSVSDVTIIVIKPSVLSTDISGIIILNAPVLIMSIL